MGLPVERMTINEDLLTPSWHGSKCLHLAMSVNVTQTADHITYCFSLSKLNCGSSVFLHLDFLVDNYSRPGDRIARISLRFIGNIISCPPPVCFYYKYCHRRRRGFKGEDNRHLSCFLLSARQPFAISLCHGCRQRGFQVARTPPPSKNI